MKNIAVLIVGYNRLEPIVRLLNSLKKAKYPDNHSVPLVISLDYSDNLELRNFVSEYDWPYGKKEVVFHEKRLGLKNHILECGDYSQYYDGLILLEDDLIVSPNYYIFSLDALSFYENDISIAGVSLYSNQINQTAMLPFEPEASNFDNYFIQYAQSWGQLWTYSQWKEFKNWLNTNLDRTFTENYIPWNVREWGEKSWLKYHILYCIENNKYFVYPYVSLTTNFSEAGEHNNSSNTAFQVQMDYRSGYKYNFGGLESEHSLKYDAFFERSGCQNSYIENIPLEDICFDIYGKKEDFGSYKYIASTQVLPKKVIRTFGLTLRPHERNVIDNIEGRAIILYENTGANTNKNLKIDKDINYYFKLVGKTNLKALFLRFLKVFLRRP